MGLVSVVTSGKGGAGKSTVTAGLGCALARRGNRVLVVDTDAGLRSLDLMLGVGGSAVYDMADIFDGNCEPIRAIYPLRYARMYLWCLLRSVLNSCARPGICVSCAADSLSIMIT